MKKIFSLLGILFFMANAIAQNVGINNTDPKAALDVNGGFRLRSENATVSGTSVMLNSNRSHHVLIGSPTGDFNIAFIGATEDGQHVIITNNTTFKGFLVPIYIQPYTTIELVYSGAAWKQIGNNEAISKTAWSLTGNAGIDTSVNFIGTTDNVPFVFKVNNKRYGLLDAYYRNITFGTAAYSKLRSFNPGANVAIGTDALLDDTTGNFNTAIGHSSMIFTKSAGSQNTALGSFSLKYNIGTQNTALGSNAMEFHNSGNHNTAVGAYAYSNKLNGTGNTALGYFSMAPNINRDNYGNYNTAVGMFSLRESQGSGAVSIGYKAAFTDTAADGIVAIGRSALQLSNGKKGVLAIGDSALYNNGVGSVNATQGNFNLAIGSKALFKNTTGSGNIAIGASALFNNQMANGIVAIGDKAAYNVNLFDGMVAIGRSASYNTTNGGDITAVGDSALFYNINGNKNTAVGSRALMKNLADYNTAVGDYALYNNTTGGDNTALGQGALFSNTDGDGNTVIGALALAGNNGYYNTVVGTSNLNESIRNISYSVFLGAGAGRNETTSSKLYIDNSSADKDNALIYGDFGADSLLLNAKTINKFSLNVRTNNALEMGYGTVGKQTDAGKICYGCFGDPAHWLGIVGGGLQANVGNDRVIKLWSEGGLRIKGNALPDANNFYTLGTSGQRWKEVWTNAATINSSDARLKTNIQKSIYGLDKVMQMRPVQYNWKTSPNTDKQIGFLAQDMLTIIPEAVVVPENGDPMGMKYTELIPVLVKAIQEQQKQIDDLKKENAAIKNKLGMEK